MDNTARPGAALVKTHFSVFPTDRDLLSSTARGPCRARERSQRMGRRVGWRAGKKEVGRPLPATRGMASSSAGSFSLPRPAALISDMDALHDQ